MIELYFSGSSYEEAAVALAVPIGSVGPDEKSLPRLPQKGPRPG